MKLSFKHLFLGLFIGFGLLVGVISQFPDNKLHIVFCDVGQGDAIYIRTPSNQDMLIDGGPSGQRVLRCLSDHMPFWDRTIDVVAFTHPQADHIAGLVDVLDRYTVLHFVSSPIRNSTKGFEELKKLVADKQIPITNPYTGSKMKMGNVSFNTLWPDREWFIAATKSQLSIVNSQKSDNVLGTYTTTEDLNSFSLYFHIQMGDFDVLLTGDGDIKMQDDLMTRVTLPDVEVLKVPHHGSKTGMTERYLDVIKPELAVISVGKNSYGHPAQSIIDMLIAHGAKVLRTDEHGDVEVVSDGKGWEVK